MKTLKYLLLVPFLSLFFACSDDFDDVNSKETGEFINWSFIPAEETNSYVFSFTKKDDRYVEVMPDAVPTGAKIVLEGNTLFAEWPKEGYSRRTVNFEPESKIILATGVISYEVVDRVVVDIVQEAGLNLGVAKFEIELKIVASDNFQIYSQEGNNSSELLITVTNWELRQATDNDSIYEFWFRVESESYKESAPTGVPLAIVPTVEKSIVWISWPKAGHCTQSLYSLEQGTKIAIASGVESFGFVSRGSVTNWDTDPAWPIGIVEFTIPVTLVFEE